MRLAAYTATSVALATSVILNALHQRTNFYSASVYLAQSNACLMILTNIALLVVSVFMLGLQKLLYGTLRPIEIEQLYEKAWFAITETCLAMTIFREEVGGWFLVMFVSLLVGKVWGWIGEGRVEILEQQPPSNPRLFHTRLSISLIVSLLFDACMLTYSVNTVLRHARPNMMVMFAFEFAVLCVTASSTTGRYLISLREAFIIRSQTQERRTQLQRSQSTAAETSGTATPPTNNSDPQVSHQADSGSMNDATDIDVPGWEEKGRWVFYLDLATDFLKLILYLAFFGVLCMFYGMPIHIIRDVALTIRSFHKRLLDFVRYRQATRDMNTRYPDASPDDVRREDCCIICREDMTPWPQGSSPHPGETTERPPFVDERFRPKRLPCGHVLHFACLKSWLERQQNCPTCRMPVLDNRIATQQRPPGVQQPMPRDQNSTNIGQRQRLDPHQAAQEPQGQNVLQLGPLRIVLAGRNVAPNANPRAGRVDGAVDAVEGNGQLHTTVAGPAATQTLRGAMLAQTAVPTALQLQQIEQSLLRDLNALHLQANQLFYVRLLHAELSRLRTMAGQHNTAATQSNQFSQQRPHAQPTNIRHQFANIPAFSSLPTSSPITPGDHQWPTGIIVPDGWTLLPLQPVLGSPATGSGRVEPPISTTGSASPFGGAAVSSRQPPSRAHLNGERTTSNVQGGDEPIANHPAASLPHWGSPTVQGPDEKQAQQSDQTHPTPDKENRGQSMEHESEASKGKSRVATVEDGPEDVD